MAGKGGFDVARRRLPFVIRVAVGMVWGGWVAVLPCQSKTIRPAGVYINKTKEVNFSMCERKVGRGYGLVGVAFAFFPCPSCLAAGDGRRIERVIDRVPTDLLLLLLFPSLYTLSYSPFPICTAFTPPSPWPPPPRPGPSSAPALHPQGTLCGARVRTNGLSGKAQRFFKCYM